MNKHHLDILIESEVNPPKLTQEQIVLIDYCVSSRMWKYENGVVNVYDSINLNGRSLTSIPVQFGKVKGHFSCMRNQLTSLKGAPSEVEGNFNCDENNLTTLEYVPTKIGGVIWCTNNNFILNDKLFEDLKRIGGEKKISYYDEFIQNLYDQISPQFGVTDKNIIDKIFMSYLNILEGNK